jgi:hypothetical protein
MHIVYRDRSTGQFSLSVLLSLQAIMVCRGLYPRLAISELHDMLPCIAAGSLNRLVERKRKREESDKHHPEPESGTNAPSQRTAPNISHYVRGMYYTHSNFLHAAPSYCSCADIHVCTHRCIRNMTMTCIHVATGTFPVIKKQGGKRANKKNKKNMRRMRRHCGETNRRVPAKKLQIRVAPVVKKG